MVVWLVLMFCTTVFTKGQSCTSWRTKFLLPGKTGEEVTTVTITSWVSADTRTTTCRNSPVPRSSSYGVKWFAFTTCKMAASTWFALLDCSMQSVEGTTRWLFFWYMPNITCLPRLAKVAVTLWR